jgi:hypothetical protein
MANHLTVQQRRALFSEYVAQRAKRLCQRVKVKLPVDEIRNRFRREIEQVANSIGLSEFRGITEDLLHRTFSET